MQCGKASSQGKPKKPEAWVKNLPGWPKLQTSLVKVDGLGSLSQGQLISGDIEI